MRQGKFAARWCWVDQPSGISMSQICDFGGSDLQEAGSGPYSIGFESLAAFLDPDAVKNEDGKEEDSKVKTDNGVGGEGERRQLSS